MEDPVRLQLFITGDPRALEVLAFNCAYDAVQASSDFMCTTPPSDAYLDVTYFAFGEPRGYARIHGRAPTSDDHVDAVICAFSCVRSEHTLNALVAANRAIDLATPEHKILVLLLEHRKIYETRKTDVISLDLYLAQHGRVGYQRFDISGHVAMASLLLDVLTTVRRAHAESVASRSLASGLPYIGVVNWLSNIATPLTCRPDPPISEQPLPASQLAAEAASLYSPPTVDPAVVEAGQIMIRHGLQRNTPVSSPPETPRPWYERLMTIGVTSKTE